MSNTDLIQLCSSHINSTAAEQLKSFLKRMKQQYTSDTPGILIKFLITELSIFFFFSILTGRPSLELFLSLLPFELMVLAAYTITLIAVIFHNAQTLSRISHALSHPESIMHCPNPCTFLCEKRERIGADISSSPIRSAYFQGLSNHPEHTFYVSLKTRSILFDLLEPSCQYHLFAVDGTYVCFVKCWLLHLTDKLSANLPPLFVAYGFLYSRYALKYYSIPPSKHGYGIYPIPPPLPLLPLYGGWILQSLSSHPPPW